MTQFFVSGSLRGVGAGKKRPGWRIVFPMLDILEFLACGVFAFLWFAISVSRM